MKQKYTLSIADMEINVVTDESQETVEHIVGILDRKIREISLKSKRCSKNEAALLCALDFCADKVRTKEIIEELEDRNEALSEQVKNLNEKLDYIQKASDRLDIDRSRLELENSKLRSILDDLRAGKNIAEPVAEPIANSEPVAPVNEAAPEIAEETIIEDIASAESSQPEKLSPALKKMGSNKNRVGSMFDLLTFSEV